MVNAQEVIARALALSEAATPAPWRADTGVRGDVVVWGPDGAFLSNAQAEPHWLPAPDGSERQVQFDVDRRDAEFIAAARTLLPALARALGGVLALADLADSGTGAYRRVVHTAQIDRAITDALSEVTP